MFFLDKIVGESELEELEELSKILSSYKEKVNLKRQVSQCFLKSDFEVFF